jgi:hypothetical protein
MGRGDLSGCWLVNLFDQRARGMHLPRILGRDWPVATPRNNSVLPLLLNYNYYYYYYYYYYYCCCCCCHNGI